MHIKAFKEVLAWVVVKYFRFNNIVILLKTIMYTTKLCTKELGCFKLKNNVVHVYILLHMWCLVMYHVMHNCGIQLFSLLYSHPGSYNRGILQYVKVSWCLLLTWHNYVITVDVSLHIQRLVFDIGVHQLIRAKYIRM